MGCRQNTSNFYTATSVLKHLKHEVNCEFMIYDWMSDIWQHPSQQKKKEKKFKRTIWIRFFWPLWFAVSLPSAPLSNLPPLTVWQADVWAARWGGDSAGSPLPGNWLSHTASQSWQIGFLGIREHVGEGGRPGIIWQGEGFNCRCKCVCLTSH